MKPFLRGDKSKQVLDYKKHPCKCKTQNWTTTESINSETSSVIDNVTNAVIDESTSTENPIIFKHDPNFIMSDPEQNETGSDNNLIPEDHDYPDYDYTPVNGSALQQLVSHVYPNNTTRQDLHKQKKKRLRKRTMKKIMKKTLTLAIKKTPKKTLHRAVAHTHNFVIKRKHQKPMKKVIRNSRTKSKLRKKSVKPIHKSSLRIHHVRSEDQPFDDLRLTAFRAKVDSIFILDALKFKSIDVLGLKTQLWE